MEWILPLIAVVPMVVAVVSSMVIHARNSKRVNEAVDGVKLMKYIPPPPPPKKTVVMFCCGCHENVTVSVPYLGAPFCRKCGDTQLFSFRPDPPSPPPKNITKKPRDAKPKPTGRVIEFEE